jgi:hypothetical protein
MEVQGQFLASAMIWMVWFVTEGSYWLHCRVKRMQKELKQVAGVSSIGLVEWFSAGF